MTPSESLVGSIVIFQDRMWYGDPRRGSFVARVDGHSAGTIAVLGSVRVEAQPGQHSVRIRQWWYRSPQIEVTVTPGVTVYLRGDIDRSKGTLSRMVKMFFAPSSSLALEIQNSGPAPDRLQNLGRAMQPVKRRQPVIAGVQTAGLLIAILGIDHKVTTLAIIGVAIFVAGLILGIRTFITARRGAAREDVN
jgi:hypothetical protein